MPRVSVRVGVLTLFLGAIWYSQNLAAADGPASTTSPANGYSTPIQAAQAMDAAIRTGDISWIREATTGGTDGDYLALKSWSDYFVSSAKLHRAAAKQFGETSGALFPVPASIFDHEEAIESKVDGDRATLFARANRQPLLYLSRAEDGWRVDLRQLNKTGQSANAAVYRGSSKVMDRIAGEIADGQYTSAQEAAAAFKAGLQPILSPGTGDLTLAREAPSTLKAVDSPPKSPIPGYDPKIVDAHREKYPSSTIPMSVELVLKLLGRMPVDSFALQEPWKDKHDGNFSDFDNKTIDGVTFHHKFDQPRGNEFPTEDLFDTVDEELDHGRYVIISVYTGRSFMLYVIVGRTADSDYHAVGKAGDQMWTVTNVKPRVREMKGTDILTYTIAAPKDAAK